MNEANNISEELKRGINFMLKMVATQTKSGTGSDVQVQVTYGGSEEVLWDAETFLDRVYVVVAATAAAAVSSARTVLSSWDLKSMQRMLRARQCGSVADF